MNKKFQITYPISGVDYRKIDPLKILAQKAAQKTAKNISDTGFKELPQSRGESAYVIDCNQFYLASITECLGTKALVADEMRKITGKTYYDDIAQDTIAMAVNDIVAVGAKPISVHAYWAAGSSEWFDDEKRIRDLVNGWKKACNLSEVSWGGGETPALTGVVEKNAIDLAASCVGIIKPKSRLTLGDKLKSGDVIVVFASSGIHANGLTLARKIAEKLPKGYATKINGKSMYGEALLKPTTIYTKLIDKLFKNKIDIHYMVNITGHGWLKIMRHPNKFTYRITKLPPVPDVLKFIVEKANLEHKDAYSSLNMGAGFAIFIPEKDVKKTLSISKKTGINAYVIGLVEKGTKQVIIEPLKIIYEGKVFKLRK
ncbi:phosphoribosylformylglycinamidine cyclo-ligase [Candidatus Woesebacteria bacterium RBG_16_34_12]|uniref:Phosphoribosylformylglycinamidine cyclo-ligase n=1 Tax=Candidatus Woesebacteria bacterium RBG_16_34_12 TaxID=1802480 RepID=A0A1F7XAR8_9BACT|nr:MAG: phosphoribosylformylglycinamidine cyclo-ligase [Candidatus Woesebacteria bacterium RBG_16_34_12]